MERGRLSGSFTVEMSLLCALMLPLLIAIMITGFYISDRASLQGMACEAAMMGSNLATYDDADSRLSGIVKGLSERHMTWTRDMKISASASKESAAAQAGGTFPVPGAIAMFMEDGELPISISCNVRIWRPANLIRKVRGVKHLIDTLEE